MSTKDGTRGEWNRRDLFGLIATGGALGAAGCAVGRPGRTRQAPAESAALTASELHARLADLDRRLDSLADRNVLAGAVPASRQTAADSAANELGRKALRALTMAASLREIPPANRRDPALQARLASLMPELDMALFSVTAHLKALTPAERTKIQRRLREDPETSLKISEAFDTAAKDIGVPLGHRLHLRQLVNHVSWRMRKQPLDTLLDEYVDKVEKVAERTGQTTELQRYLVAAAAESALLCDRADCRAVALAGPPKPPLARARPALEPEPRDKPGKPGSTAITAGAWMLGIGALVGGVGALVTAAGAFAGVFAITLGALGFVIGLFTLIIGAIIRAAS